MTWTRAGAIAAAGAAMVLAGCASLRNRPAKLPQELDDVVYLNDGGKLHGKIVERLPGTSLSLRTRQGMLHVVADSQIRRVTPRSASGTAAGLPPVRMSDSTLVGQWARIETSAMGTREGRVVGLDAGTLVVRETGRLGKTTIPRAEIQRALVSTAQSTRAGPQAVESGLSGAVGMFLVTYTFTAFRNAALAGRAAAFGSAAGVVMGAAFGSLERTHGAWRRLDLIPTPSAPPVSSGLQVGVRVRR